METASQELEQGAAALNGAAQNFAEVADAEQVAHKLSDEHDDLAAHADSRRDLRRRVDKVEMRLAFRDLADGVRGFIRVKPFTAVLAGVLVGAALARRSKGKRSVRRSV
jgi:hypothetical protein